MVLNFLVFQSLTFLTLAEHLQPFTVIKDDLNPGLPGLNSLTFLTLAEHLQPFTVIKDELNPGLPGLNFLDFPHLG
jgi:hypothetical protein